MIDWQFQLYQQLTYGNLGLPTVLLWWDKYYNLPHCSTPYLLLENIGNVLYSICTFKDAFTDSTFADERDRHVDNCNTNFGSRKHASENNVLALMRKNINDLEGSDCSAHILNNSIQHVDPLPIYLESILVKIYNYFSIYTVCIEKLKEYCLFFHVHFKQIFCHSKILWWSLYPVITRT